MSADNSHAERQILARTIERYDADRILGSSETNARECAYVEYARLTGRDETDAAIILADALARRAANKAQL